MNIQPYTNFNLQPIGYNQREGSADGVLANSDPYTHDVLVKIKLANQPDIDEAYKAAQETQISWGQTLPQQRSQVLIKAANLIDLRFEELASWLIREAGSTYLKASLELNSAKGIIMESATFPLRAGGYILPSSTQDQQSRVYRAPLGVIGVISPWNFPFHLSMRSVAPALALGNAVVIKPASDTPITGGLLLAKLFEEAGLPKGLLSVVIGAGSEIGDYFVEHPTPSLISFTGSSKVGLGVGQKSMGKYLKRVALELGGNAPLVVLDDADIEDAAHAAIVGRFLHQGQICMSTNRVIVDEKIHDKFVTEVVARAKKLKVGNPVDSDTVIGPVINKQQLDSVVNKIAQAKKDGATLVFGGEVVEQTIPPHIFTNVDPSWEIAIEETFGPVLPIIKARDEVHALELANMSQYGLSSAVFTKDLVRGVKFAQGIRAGMTHINSISVDDQANAPFGGEKNSGLGRFNGQWIIEEFTRLQWITLQTKPQPYPF